MNELEASARLEEVLEALQVVAILLGDRAEAARLGAQLIDEKHLVWLYGHMYRQTVEAKSLNKVLREAAERRLRAA
jgi:hypothetical protein